MRSSACVVTGGTGEIGRALCRDLAASGVRVINIDARTPPASESGIEDMVADLRSEREVRLVARHIAERYQVTGLVNNAGAVFPAELNELRLSDLQALVDLHLKAAVALAQEFVPDMRARNFGRIVNISTRAVLGKRARSSYAATKLGLVALTRTWALELGASGITVNAVAPGPIATNMFLRNISEKVKRDTVESTAVKRLGSPKDVANAVMFLLSEASGFITGQLLYVCGGLSIGSAPI